MDFLSLEPDESNTKDILVITDHFTKFAVAIPTPNQKARTVAKCLWENFMMYLGFPEKLHSDQGPDFESRTIKELCHIAKIHKVRTTPYHPRGNPVERFNRTLLDMLGTLNHQDKSRWRDFVRPLVHAYNCTRNEVTGFTPYELVYGFQPRLPVDLAFNLPVREGQQVSHSEYVKALKSRLEESYKVAMENAAKVAHKNKTRFDRRVTASDLEAGDRVLIRNVRLRGKHKISNKWESTVHVVVKRAGTLPVYTVRPESEDGPLRTLHRDLLLPCGYLSAEGSDAVVQKPAKRRPVTRANPAVETDHSSDEEDEEYLPVYTEVQIPEVSPNQDPAGTPGIDAPPDMTHGAPDSPLAPFESNAQWHVTEPECLPTGIVNQSGEVDEAGYSTKEINLPDDDNLPEQVNPPERDNSPGNGEPVEKERKEPVEEKNGEPVEEKREPVEEENREPVEEEKEDMEEERDENPVIPVRRSERSHQPPTKLTYPELGKPLVTVVKSFLQGLSLAFIESLEKSDCSLVI